MQAVPTSVVRGPDGAYYVGTLTGFPFQPGAARVFRVVPGKAPKIYATGFTNIIDLAFGPDRKLYVLEIAHNGLLSGDPTGALIRVGHNGSRKDRGERGAEHPGRARDPGRLGLRVELRHVRGHRLDRADPAALSRFRRR